LPTPLETEAKLLPEGAKTTISVNIYELNSKARAECIAHYGMKCQICNFEFKAIYGEIGDGFIEVHYKKPISEIGELYEVNPIEDLIPVCSNCDSMLHRRRNETMDVKVLKKIENHQ